MSKVLRKNLVLKIKKTYRFNKKQLTFDVKKKYIDFKII